MNLKFTKMHGAGNDFIVIDAIHQQIDFSPAQWKLLADRRFGIGADQILVVQKPTRADCDFRYRIFNQDGGEVEQCGNGSRAFVKFVTDKGLTTKSSIRVQTMKGIITPRIEPDGSITVDMGAPRFLPAELAFDDAGLIPCAMQDDTLYTLALAQVGEQTMSIAVSIVSMGNPHAVLLVDDVAQAPVASVGPQVEGNGRFANKVNVGFMQVVDRGHVKLRVYERGAGETLACGTGACAAVVAGIRRGLLDSPVSVSARGGELAVAWAGGDAAVYLSGPAVTVFEGEITL